MLEDLLALVSESPVDVVQLHRLLERMNTVDIAEAFEGLCA